MLNNHHKMKVKYCNLLSNSAQSDSSAFTTPISWIDFYCLGFDVI